MEKLDFKNSVIKEVLYCTHPDRYNWEEYPSNTCALGRTLIWKFFTMLLTSPTSIVLFTWNWFAEEKDNYFEWSVYNGHVILGNFLSFGLGIILAIELYVPEAMSGSTFISMYVGTYLFILYAWIIGFPFLTAIVLAFFILIGIVGLFIHLGEIVGEIAISRYKRLNINLFKWKDNGKERKPSAVLEAYRSWKDKVCKPINWS